MVHDICEVAVSQYHAGQICYPVVTEQLLRGQGDNRVLEVRWYWVDTSFPRGTVGREYGRGHVRGRVMACRNALRKAGIRIDDSRSYV